MWDRHRRFHYASVFVQQPVAQMLGSNLNSERLLIKVWSMRAAEGRFHGMEEVVGSIPTRSTNYVKHLAPPPFRDFVASLSQIPKPHHETASQVLPKPVWWCSRESPQASRERRF